MLQQTCYCMIWGNPQHVYMSPPATVPANVEIYFTPKEVRYVILQTKRNAAATTERKIVCCLPIGSAP
jgi:hypothetical protein